MRMDIKSSVIEELEINSKYIVLVPYTVSCLGHT